MYSLTARLLNYAMQKLIHKIVIITLSLTLISCVNNGSRNIYVGDTETLQGLQALNTTRGALVSATQSSGKIRIMALRETALSLGAQSGLAFRAKIIDEILTRQARRLDAIYDFNSLLLPNDILPPVLAEGRNILNLADPGTIRIADRVYKILKQARFVTTPPNWRQYLWMDYQKPEVPDVTLLPKTREERQLWAQCIEQSWKNGVEQANTIFEENVARINQDFAGMILYRKLLALKMISEPFVAHTELGVTGDGDKIYIDDKVLRITALPQLNVNSREWRAALKKEKNELEKFTKMQKQIESAKIKITSNSWQEVITT